mmetsp:Transcript_34402/g.53683  ORF Transcript_34402/g.53683 Transcript_34402/m.53683 type:complete len:194 (+) Transcript_34402:140-721(+)
MPKQASPSKFSREGSHSLPSSEVAAKLKVWQKCRQGSAELIRSHPASPTAAALSDQISSGLLRSTSPGPAKLSRGASFPGGRNRRCSTTSLESISSASSFSNRRVSNSSTGRRLSLADSDKAVSERTRDVIRSEIEMANLAEKRAQRSSSTDPAILRMSLLGSTFELPVLILMAFVLLLVCGKELMSTQIRSG